MYTVFAIAGINVMLISVFPTHEDCRVWLNANRYTVISILESLPVQAPEKKPLFFCSQKPPVAGTPTE